MEATGSLLYAQPFPAGIHYLKISRYLRRFRQRDDMNKFREQPQSERGAVKRVKKIQNAEDRPEKFSAAFFQNFRKRAVGIFNAEPSADEQRRNADRRRKQDGNPDP